MTIWEICSNKTSKSRNLIFDLNWPDKDQSSNTVIAWHKRKIKNQLTKKKNAKVLNLDNTTESCCWQHDADVTTVWTWQRNVENDHEWTTYQSSENNCCRLHKLAEWMKTAFFEAGRQWHCAEPHFSGQCSACCCSAVTARTPCSPALLYKIAPYWCTIKLLWQQRFMLYQLYHSMRGALFSQFKRWDNPCRMGHKIT